jgi:hypothetical protein
VTGTVECETHGKTRPAAFVCCHLVETLRDRAARGLLWSRDENGNVNAYCDACDQMLEQAGGDWTEELGARAKVQLICEDCFWTIERANGQGGEA